MKRILELFVSALIGMFLSYCIWNNTAEIISLKTELGRSKIEIDRFKRSGANLILSRNKNISHRNHTPYSGPITNILPNLLHNKLIDHITQEDINTTIELENRKNNGEYILKYDIPFNRRLRDENTRTLASNIISNRAPELYKVFDRLGLKNEPVSGIIDHLTKIAEASLQVETGILQFQEAQNAYDKRLKSLLSKVEYNKYRQYEADAPSVKEFSKLQTYAQGQGMAFDESHATQMIEMLKNNNAYTTEQWHGPFDNIPQPTTGLERVVPYLEEDIKKMDEYKNNMIKQLNDMKYPPEYKALIESYYNKELLNRNLAMNEYKNMMDPNYITKKMEETEKRVLSQIKRDHP